MKAIHNCKQDGERVAEVVSKSKDTSYLKAIHNVDPQGNWAAGVVSKSKDTSYLKAIHNASGESSVVGDVVSKSKDTSYLKAIHNPDYLIKRIAIGCFKEQRYKLFESNSQQKQSGRKICVVVSKSKDTSYLKAIHNVWSEVRDQ